MHGLCGHFRGETLVALFRSSQPILENSAPMKLDCYLGSYRQMEDHGRVECCWIPTSVNAGATDYFSYGIDRAYVKISFDELIDILKRQKFVGNLQSESVLEFFLREYV